MNLSYLKKKAENEISAENHNNGIIVTSRTMKAAIQAMVHCRTTMPSAIFVPDSLFTAAIAATHGV